MQKRKLTSSKYETPRLETYGKLRDLTKGVGSPLEDAGLQKTQE
ncbi:MAG: lasso RiPP family leader peptide-containing protein [Chloroflexota bacterium]|nr:lasso RiPP family leader peptide-containing protein [Chloroflexota bacterium]